MNNKQLNQFSSILNIKHSFSYVGTKFYIYDKKSTCVIFGGSLKQCIAFCKGFNIGQIH